MAGTSLGVIYSELRINLANLQADANNAKSMLTGLRDSINGLFTTDAPLQPLQDELAQIPVSAEDAFAKADEAAVTGGEELAAAAEETGAKVSTVFEELGARIGEFAASVKEQLASAGAGMAEFADRARLGGEQISGFGGMLGEGIGRLKDFGTSMLAFGAMNVAFDAVHNMVGGMAGFNAELQQLHSQLTSITGSSGEADKLMAWARNFGQTIPDTTEHLYQAVVQLQSFGLNAEQVMPPLANVAAAMGTDLPTAAQALTDAMNGRFRMLQFDLHVSKEQLEQYGLEVNKSGQVLNNSLLPAFIKFANTRFPHGTVTQMQTLNGQLSNLTDRIQIFTGQIGNRVFKEFQGWLQDLFSFLNTHQAQVTAFANALADGIGNALAFIMHAGEGLVNLVAGIVGFFTQHRAAVEALKGAIIALGVAIAIGLVPALFGAEGALAGLTAISLPFTATGLAIGAAIAAVVLGLKALYDHSAAVRSAVNGLVTTLKAGFLAAIAAARKIFAELLPHLKAAAAWLGQHLRVALEQLAPKIAGAINAVRGFIQEIGPKLGPALHNIAVVIGAVLAVVGKLWNFFWPSIAEYLKGAWDEIQGIIQIAWSIISGIFKIALDLIGGNWKGAWKDLQQMLAGVWDGIKKVVQGGLEQIWAYIGRPLTAIKDFFGTIFGAIGRFFDGFFHGAQKKTSDGLSLIQRIVRGALNLLVGYFTAPFRLIGALFSWLYNHNVYFKRLVDGIKEDFTRAKQFIVAVWTTIKEWLSAAWKFIQTAASAAFHFVVSIIQADLTVAHNVITTIWNKVVGFLQGVWKTVQTDVANAWNAFVSTISNIVGKVQGAVKQVTDTITKPIADLAKTAISWGENLIKMFIQGITNKLGDLKNTLGNIAENIAGFLGFHSPAEMGPGRDADRWMPNLMGMLATGLAAGAPDLAAAARKAASGVAAAFGPGGVSIGAPSTAAGYPATAGSAGSGPGDIYNTINLTVEVNTDEDDGNLSADEVGTRFGRSAGTALAAALAQRGY